MLKRIVFILVVCMCMLCPVKSSSANGYQALVPCEEGFLAAGSGGRLDWIKTAGVVSKTLKLDTVGFHALLSTKEYIVVVGERGTVFVSTDKATFQKLHSGTEATIFSLVRFKDLILAGSEQGLLLVGNEQGQIKNHQLPVEGNIVSLSARANDCFGVTDKGEILRSTDGLQWTVLDFNAYYAGYYKPCSFSGILALEHQISAVGQHEDGSPALLLSSEGGIWSERSLTYTDEEGRGAYLTEIPASMAYDAVEDQLLLVCSKGKIMKVPACSHCNKLITVSSSDLTGLANKGEQWLVVGVGFHVQSLTAGWK